MTAQAGKDPDSAPAVLPVLKAIVRCFGPSSEASLVRLEEDGRAVVLAIENGSVTGRRKGDEAGAYAPSLCADLPAGEPVTRVVTGTTGRRFKCTSARIGPGLAISIVIETTVLEFMSGFLQGLLDTPPSDWAARPAAGPERDAGQPLFDLRKALTSMLREAETSVGRPVTLMTREDKLRVIGELDRRGVFLLRNSVEDVARALQISRFTVYNYLDSVRQSAEGGTQNGGGTDA
ncbi:MAG: hypothetical protein HPY55_00265 [Firmicutes bacterium]|nr:hypothetical protein [Bacillota bacterium]